ncbi:Glucose-repressible protein [Lignoscripta atroalba]|nr:Glucose-repressible protein [Lignoscripta atroalba]
MDTVKNAANYVSDSVSSATAGASKEANKNVAKDDNASLGTRASAAKDAVGDKMDESKDSVYLRKRQQGGREALDAAHNITTRHFAGVTGSGNIEDGIA